MTSSARRQRRHADSHESGPDPLASLSIEEDRIGRVFHVPARHEYAAAIRTRRDEDRIASVGLHRRFHTAAGRRVDGPDLAAWPADIHPVARGVHPDVQRSREVDHQRRAPRFGCRGSPYGAARRHRNRRPGSIARPHDTERGRGNSEGQLLGASVEHRELAVVHPALHAIRAAGDDEARARRRIPSRITQPGAKTRVTAPEPSSFQRVIAAAATDDDELLRPSTTAMVPTNPSWGRMSARSVRRCRGSAHRYAEQVAAIHGPEFDGCGHPGARLVELGSRMLRPVDPARREVDQRDPTVARRDDAGVGDDRHGDVRRSGGIDTVAITAAVFGSTTSSGPSTVPYTRRPSGVKRTAPARSVFHCASWTEVPPTCRMRPVFASISRSDADLVDGPDQVALVVHRDGTEREVEFDRRQDQVAGRDIGDREPDRPPGSPSSSKIRSACATRAPSPLTAGPYRLSVSDRPSEDRAGTERSPESTS